MFLKYIRRCEASAEHIRLHEARLLALKENLRKRQMKILDLWMRKKQQLDRCHEACLLEATATEVVLSIMWRFLESFYFKVLDSMNFG